MVYVWSICSAKAKHSYQCERNLLKEIWKRLFAVRSDFAWGHGPVFQMNSGFKCWSSVGFVAACAYTMMQLVLQDSGVFSYWIQNSGYWSKLNSGFCCSLCLHNPVVKYSDCCYSFEVFSYWIQDSGYWSKLVWWQVATCGVASSGLKSSHQKDTCQIAVVPSKFVPTEFWTQIDPEVVGVASGLLTMQVLPHLILHLTCSVCCYFLVFAGV